MSWQVNYAIQNINKHNSRYKAEHVRDDVIRILVPDQPDTVALISAEDQINLYWVESYVQSYPEINFICGYKKKCVWEGDAITSLEHKLVGWGNPSTMLSAAIDGNAAHAEHKTYVFSARLIRQYRAITHVKREFDRVFKVTLKSGKELRIGLIDDYEPTSDNIREFHDRFGHIDIAWNINPNGSPCKTALEAGEELGCLVLKNEGLKQFLATA